MALMDHATKNVSWQSLGGTTLRDAGEIILPSRDSDSETLVLREKLDTIAAQLKKKDEELAAMKTSMNWPDGRSIFEVIAALNVLT